MATNYIGNPDYRGWLNANPDNRWALSYVGNDGGVNQQKVTDNFYSLNGGDQAATESETMRSDANNRLRGLYSQYLSSQNEPFNPGSSGGGNSSGASGASPADLAYYDSQSNQLRDMLGRTQNTLDQGLTNLGDSYNREVGGANQQRSRALEDFQVKREDTTRAKQEALGQVDTNARTLNDSLRRVLGLASGSGSSAYQLAAPNAVAREASGKRNGVLSNYATNDRNIATSEKRATEDFGSLLDDLARQRSDKERELRTGVLQSEQDLNAKLGDNAAQRAAALGGDTSAIQAAQSPYDAAIADRRSQIDSLFERFRTPTFAPKPVTVQAPNLRDYMVDRSQINANNQSGASQQQQYNPYSYPLRKNLEDQLY